MRNRAVFEYMWRVTVTEGVVRGRVTGTEGVEAILGGYKKVADAF